jgi:hypothetical protein
LKVSAQQVPHPAELNPVTAEAPPICGKWGNEPKVVKFFVSRPLDPVEHATLSRDSFLLSYLGSYETWTASADAARKRKGPRENIIIDGIG